MSSHISYRFDGLQQSCLAYKQPKGSKTQSLERERLMRLPCRDTFLTFCGASLHYYRFRRITTSQPDERVENSCLFPPSRLPFLAPFVPPQLVHITILAFQKGGRDSADIRGLRKVRSYPAFVSETPNAQPWALRHDILQAFS